LANDEENKGNLSLSQSIRNAYSPERRRETAYETSSPLTEMTFSTQNVLQTPKDKDSTLELVEILQPKVRLADVALPEKIQETLLQIIDEQKKAEDLLSRGVVPTNRLLFCGPPGCGKTLTANVLAGEIGISIAYVKLDGLVSSYLGQTGANIRKIFDFVKNKRVMLFLDEFDAIAKKRDDANELGELKRVVTTLLQNMDAMPASVFFVAATNHHHLLDPAIWRRFNMSILLELPNDRQRELIISRFLQETLANYKVSMKTMIVLTKNMSGAQICNFLQSLARYCIMQNKCNEVSNEDIASVWLKQSTLLAREDSETFDNALYELSKAGIPLRTLEEITGIPKSTINYRFKQMEDT
jgi:SpoVK/Ycf46/Vps4 family AAA+-type ATPase